MKRSFNPLTKESYEIPQKLDDKLEIDSFLNLNKNKKIVVVQGLGFVGAVMSIVCANAKNNEYAVIGIDLPNPQSYWKIKSINDGLFPIKSSDPKVEKFFNISKKRKNFFATYDNYAFSKADIIIVDINLDVDKKSTQMKDLLSFNVDLSPFKSAITTIGKNCKDDALILVETTVPPGCCVKIVKPIIDKVLKTRKLSSKVKIAHSYERVMPGPNYVNSIVNFYRVYSGVDKISADAAEIFLKTIISTEEYPLTRLKSTTSTEMAKVLENSFRAMNISFIVEWSRFAEECGIDIYEIIKAIRLRPTHKNIMLPGLGVGGYCLTKDPLLASWAKTNLFESQEGLNMSELGVKTNDKMPFYAYKFLKNSLKIPLKNLNVLFLGVSYLSNVGDTRYSPVELFYDCLIEEDCNISLHDPYVRYWEEKKINIDNSLEKILDKKVYDIIIITTGHTDYKYLVNKFMSLEKVIIYDTIGIYSEKEIEKIKTKHIIKIIGRGDI